MSMKKEGIVFLACALGLVLAPACSSSAPSAEPPEAGGSSSGSLKGITPGSSGASTETQILCLGNFYCAQGTVCCGSMATSNVECSTGPSCPFGTLQICMADADCVGGGACSPITFMGISLGTCGLGGLGGSSSSSGSSGSGNASSDANASSSSGGSDGGGDGAPSPASDASPG